MHLDLTYYWLMLLSRSPLLMKLSVVWRGTASATHSISSARSLSVSRRSGGSTPSPCWRRDSGESGRRRRVADGRWRNGGAGRRTRYSNRYEQKENLWYLTFLSLKIVLFYVLLLQVTGNFSFKYISPYKKSLGFGLHCIIIIGFWYSRMNNKGK